ncbi:MAG: UDP-N-acetylglucosamine--N-acetylmuramyl-(pentapeptide) pyrophosphoryl-undecaprenol N-acetylglucosamine transferase [Patescibacteria group bacterium]
MMHQLDVEPGLTNKLIAPLATSVTTSFAYATSPFAGVKHVHRIATPVRFVGEVMTRAEGANVFGLDAAKPIVLIMGGGTGAQALNEAFLTKQDAWFKDMQVIHVSGKGKKAADSSYEFLDAERMRAAYAAADVVITRAGLGSLSEIVALQKPCIIVPIPGSHQEANAQAFAKADAAIVLDQRTEGFAAMLHACALAMVQHPEEAKKLVSHYDNVMTTDGGESLADRIDGIL